MSKRFVVVAAVIMVIAAMVVVTGCGTKPTLVLGDDGVIKVNIGTKGEVSISATDSTGADDTVSVKVDDGDVAKAEVDGGTITVTGKEAGTTTLTVTSGSGKTEEVGVSVREVLNLDEIPMFVGNELELDVDAYNKKGETDSISVSTSNAGVATVSAASDDGSITIDAVGAGTATITVESDAGATFECDVTVAANLEIEGHWIAEAGDYSAREEFTNTSWKKYSGTVLEVTTGGGTLAQECEIVGGSNSDFNGGDSESSDCGFILIKYTNPSVWLPNSENRYGILRWKNIDTLPDPDEMDYAEGWLDLNGDSSGDHFVFPSDALTRMTDAAGAFSMYTEDAYYD
jgi:hypothetical protein